MNITLTKTDFLKYLNCDKSLWIQKNKPSSYKAPKKSIYEEKLSEEGYKVQNELQKHLNNKPDAKQYSFEITYETSDGLLSIADIVKENQDGTLNLYEVKSSGNINDNHIIDATFQTITMEKSGSKVKDIYIVHINKDYVRGEHLDISQMMEFSLVTNEVRNRIEELKISIKAALDLLNKPSIDETSCSCLKLGRSNHCECFDYFNSKIPKPSIYNLPRITKNKIEFFSSDGRYGLENIKEDEVSSSQLKVLQSAKLKKPIISKNFITSFFNMVKYPLYFFDFETYSSAIPIIKGVKPHAHIPFQFSLHVKKSINSSEYGHFEFLADNAELPLKLIEYMEKVIGSKGSIISWHKSFEITRNKEMADLYPDKSDFLNNINIRMIDLEDIFKDGYVDIQFGGSTSIKKVLPIITDLSYDDLEVANGTDAMGAFIEMIDTKDNIKKMEIRKKMLKYCERDTLAMVKIFEKMKEYI